MKQIKYKGDCFYSFKDGADVSDDEIQEMIDGVVEDVTENGLLFSYAATGNTIVIGYSHGGDAKIVVTKGYDEAELVFEDNEWNPIDYKKEEMKDYLESLPRHELIEMLLRSEYDPRKEI